MGGLLRAAAVELGSGAEMQFGGSGSAELWDEAGDRLTMLGWMHMRRALHSAAVHCSKPPSKMRQAMVSLVQQSMVKQLPLVCELLLGVMTIARGAVGPRTVKPLI